MLHFDITIVVEIITLSLRLVVYGSYSNDVWIFYHYSMEI